MKIITTLFLLAAFMMLSYIKAGNVYALDQQKDSTKVDYKNKEIRSVKMSAAQYNEWKKDKKYFDAHGVHFRVIKDTAWKQ